MENYMTVVWEKYRKKPFMLLKPGEKLGRRLTDSGILDIVSEDPFAYTYREGAFERINETIERILVKGFERSRRLKN